MKNKFRPIAISRWQGKSQVSSEKFRALVGPELDFQVSSEKKSSRMHILRKAMVGSNSRPQYRGGNQPWCGQCWPGSRSSEIPKEVRFRIDYWWEISLIIEFHFDLVDLSAMSVVWEERGGSNLTSAEKMENPAPDFTCDGVSWKHVTIRFLRILIFKLNCFEFLHITLLRYFIPFTFFFYKFIKIINLLFDEKKYIFFKIQGNLNFLNHITIKFTILPNAEGKKLLKFKQLELLQLI